MAAATSARHNGRMGVVQASHVSALNSTPPVSSAAVAAVGRVGMNDGVGCVPGVNDGRTAGAAIPGLSSRATLYNSPGIGQAGGRHETDRCSQVDAGFHQYPKEDKKEPRPPQSLPRLPPGATPGWLSKSIFT